MTRAVHTELLSCSFPSHWFFRAVLNPQPDSVFHTQDAAQEKEEGAVLEQSVIVSFFPSISLSQVLLFFSPPSSVWEKLNSHQFTDCWLVRLCLKI